MSDLGSASDDIEDVLVSGGGGSSTGIQALKICGFIDGDLDSRNIDLGLIEDLPSEPKTCQSGGKES